MFTPMWGDDLIHILVPRQQVYLHSLKYPGVSILAGLPGSLLYVPIYDTSSGDISSVPCFGNPEKTDSKTPPAGGWCIYIYIYPGSAMAILCRMVAMNSLHRSSKNAVESRNIL